MWSEVPAFRQAGALFAATLVAEATPHFLNTFRGGFVHLGSFLHLTVVSNVPLTQSKLTSSLDPFSCGLLLGSGRHHADFVLSYFIWLHLICQNALPRISIPFNFMFFNIYYGDVQPPLGCCRLGVRFNSWV